jgi:serine/threonine protein kinase
LLLEYFLNGYFLDINLSYAFKDFLSCCLQIDADKRKGSSFLLTHELFKGVKINTKDEILYLVPIEKEKIQSLIQKEDINKKQYANGLDNYEIFKNILKIDMLTFLKKKGMIDYKPKIQDIPNYYSLYSPDIDEYNINDETFQIKKKMEASIEFFFDKELNTKRFNDGCLEFIGNYLINLPTDYEKDNEIFQNFLKTSRYDLQLIKSEGLKSDKSSGSSKISHLDSLKAGENNKLSSKTKLSQVNPNLEKEISYYFRVKKLTYNCIFGYSSKDELISEIKRSNYHIPDNLRPIIYLIILEIDYLNDSEEFEIGTYYENRSHIQQELNQIKKDIQRCEEYDSMFKGEEGKQNISLLFECLLYNKVDFFYNQGMDSIAAALIKLYYPRLEFSYQVFYKLTQKLLFKFFDMKNKTIKNLHFPHLIISRMLAFIEPELYIHLSKIEFFDDQYAANWILTLFSSI